MNEVGFLLRARLRRDWLQLSIWFLLFLSLAAVGHSAVESSYGTVKDRAEVIAVLAQTPSVLILRGTPQGTQTDAFQFMLLFAFLAVLVGLMATFLAVRHTRGDEESGRAELVESTPAGRTSPLVATAIEGVIAVVIMGAVSTGGFLVQGANAQGSILAGTALAAVGIAFLGIGLLCAQLMRTSRGANGLAAAIVGAAYLLRGIGDATGTFDSEGLTMTAGWISWLSPIGWGQRTDPFSSPNWWPVLLPLALGALTFALALALRSRRDIDSSLIAERPGRATAPASLGGPIGLVWREVRNPVIGWAIAAALFGLLIGSLGEALTTGAGANKDLQDNLGRTVGSIAGPNAHGAFIDLFVVAMFSVMGALAAIASVQAIVRARQDEAGGTAEIVVSSPVSRLRWFGAYLVIAVVSAVAVVGVGLLGGLGGAAASGAPSHRLETILLASIAQLPAALVLAAVAALIFGILPRWTVGLGWAVLLVAIFVGQFGSLFGLPDWVRQASPFSHTPVVTDAAPDWAAAWIMLGIAVVIGAASVALVRRRDLALGG